MTIFVVTFNMFCDMVGYDNNEQVTHIRLSAGAAYLCDWHFALLAYAALPFVGRAQMCLFHPTFGQLQQLFLFSITKEGVINSIAHHQLGLLFGEDACIVELLEFLGYCGVRNSHVVGIDTNGNASSQECLKGILRHGGNASDSLGLQVARRTECQTDIFLFQQSLHIVVVPRTNTMTYTLCTIINGKPHALNAIGLTGMDGERNALFFGIGVVQTERKTKLIEDYLSFSEVQPARLKLYTTLPPLAIYITLTIAVFTLSPLMYEGIKRIPIIRWCVLGDASKVKYIK